MRVHRLLLNATALRTYRYGMGNDRHNISLYPGTWERLSQYVVGDRDDNGSAFIQIGVVMLEAVLHPTGANVGKAIDLISVGVNGNAADLMGVASNLRELAESLEMVSQQSQHETTAADNGKDVIDD